MAPDAPESPPNLAGRLRRVGEMLIGLSGSPVPTHLFQTSRRRPWSRTTTSRYPQPSAFTSANTWLAAIMASRMMGTPT